MTAYDAKHPYEPDWQIPRGVWANGPPSFTWRSLAAVDLAVGSFRKPANLVIIAGGPSQRCLVGYLTNFPSFLLTTT